MIRTIYLVHHTHTDIGYTDTIDNVLAEHVRILDDVVTLCQANARQPDGLKYKWTIETSLVLEEYAKRRPKQFRELMGLARKGLVEVTGLWAQSLTELPAVQEFTHLFGKTLGYAREHKFDVRSAMLTDIPAGAWVMPEVMNLSGVDYLINGDNTIRTLAPYDRRLPPLFWWAGPSGKQKILVWHLGLSVPEDPRKLKSLYPQYALGYFFVLWPMKGWYDPTKKKYLYDPVEKRYLNGETPPAKRLAMARAGIKQLCKKLDAGGYPYDAVLLQAGADNFGPDSELCETVKIWNEQVGTPQVRIATASEFFDHVAAKYGKRIPTLAGNISDAWSDHAATKAAEIARYREAARTIRSAGRIQAMAWLDGAEVKSGTILEAAMSPLMMASEHTYGLNTFGLHEDIIAGKLKPKDPRLAPPLKSWKKKLQYAEQAENASLAMQAGALGKLGRSSTVSGASIINTLDRARGGVVRIGSQSGKMHDVVIHSAPPGISHPTVIDGSKRDESHPTTKEDKTQIENDRYLVKVDVKSGGVKSIIDKSTGAELVDAKSRWLMNQVIVERFEGFPDYKSGGGLVQPRKRSYTLADRRSIQVDQVEWVGGPALRIRSTVQSSGVPLQIDSIIRLPSYADRVEFFNRLTRDPCLAKEAAYVAFPFQLPKSNWTLRCEIAGAVMDWKRERLPGSIGDFQAIQGAACIDHPAGSILFASPDAPLLSVGDMNCMRWKDVDDIPDRPHLFSYPMHNTWPTNCPLWQTKTVVLRYAISGSRTTPSATDIVHFGRDFAEPLFVVAGSKGSNSETHLDCKGAIVEAIEPIARNTIRVLLSDVERTGKTAVLNLRGKRKVSFARIVNCGDGLRPENLKAKAGMIAIPLNRGGLTIVEIQSR